MLCPGRRGRKSRGWKASWPFTTSRLQSINNIAIRVQAEQFQATLDQITRIWERVYPDQKLAYSFLDETVARFYEKEQRMARLVNLATCIALLISCLGVYGLSAFTAARRAKEISIRKVLGASVTGVVALLSQDYVKKLVLLSAVLAFPVAFYFMQRWLADFAYHVDIEWWMFVLATGLAVLVTLLTVSFQSLRAALARPVDALRSE